MPKPKSDQIKSVNEVGNLVKSSVGDVGFTKVVSERVGKSQRPENQKVEKDAFSLGLNLK